MPEQQAAASKRGREYETIYVMRPTVTKENAERVSKRVTEVIDREGGILTAVENWGRRTTAFPVNKHRRAVYTCVRYLGTGVVVSELERNFRMLDDVLKYQTVKLRDEVDFSSAVVKPEDIEFEAVEGPLEDEPEETLARQLGLEAPLRREERESPPSDSDEDESRADDASESTAEPTKERGEGDQ